MKLKDDQYVDLLDHYRYPPGRKDLRFRWVLDLHDSKLCVVITEQQCPCCTRFAEFQQQAPGGLATTTLSPDQMTAVEDHLPQPKAMIPKYEAYVDEDGKLTDEAVAAADAGLPPPLGASVPDVPVQPADPKPEGGGR